MGALANLETRQLPVEPGGQAVAQVRVRNTGSVVDQFTLQVLGDAAAWTTIQPPTLSLFPGAEESATVTFSPPRSPQVPAGPLPFGIRVLSREDPQGSVVEEGVLAVAPFSDVSAELAPRTSRGRGSATHDLAIDNRGNAPLNAEILAADPDRLLSFDINPPGVVADPGIASFVKVEVKPRQRFWRGAPRTRPFQVQIEQPGLQAVTVDGTMVQEAILPSWFMRAIALLVGALVALVLLWVFLVRPAIQATATERAEDILAQWGFTQPPVPPDNGGGDGDGRGGGATPSPPADGGASLPPGASPPVASAPALPGGGTATDGRLSVGEVFIVPPGKTLYITDLVFSNPGTVASGELQFTRSNAPLLVLRLENFRDLDFHFVTPIVVTAGQQIAITCPCQDAAVYYSGFQR